MAIKLEFIDIIVPRFIIEQKFPGGWQAWHAHYESVIGLSVWFDDHLFRAGAMNPIDAQNILDDWGYLGFELTGTNSSGEEVWQDVCVSGRIFGGATLPCEWLALDSNGDAYLTGTEPGKAVGPYH